MNLRAGPPSRRSGEYRQVALAIVLKGRLAAGEPRQMKAAVRHGGVPAFTRSG